MVDLSDANIRAVLAVLLNRAGGEVEIENSELYDAMLPADGAEERFTVAETTTGIRVGLRRHDADAVTR